MKNHPLPKKQMPSLPGTRVGLAFEVPRHLLLRRSGLALIASFAALALCPPLARADLYWRTDGTSAGWTSTSWSDPASTTGGTGWTSGSDAIFTQNSTVTFATSTVGNVTVADGKTVTVTQVGILSNQPLISTYDIGDGATLTWASQNVGNNTATGFIKNGNGTWNRGTGGDNNFTGGFTLNAGTVSASGSRGLGTGNLTINGGTLNSTGGFTFLVSGITVGGNFALTGSDSAIFTAPVALGDATRVITNNATGNRTFSGAIGGGSSTNMNLVIGGSGNTTLSGVISNGNAGGRLGIVKTGTGTLVIGAGGIANTFTGGVQIASGTLLVRGDSAPTNQLNSNRVTLGSATGGDASYILDTNVAQSNEFIVEQGTGNRTVTLVKAAGFDLNWKLILGKDLSVTSTAANGVQFAAEIIGNSDLIFTRSATGNPFILKNAANPGANGQLNTRNLFTGNMVVGNNATLQFGANGLNYSSAALIILNGGRFNLQNNSILGGINGESNGIVIASDGAKTLTLAGNGNYTFAGSIQNGTTHTASLAVRLNKEGTLGSQTLAGNNTYTGATSLEAGTLRLDYSAANGSKLSNTTALTFRGGNLELAGGNHTEIVGSTTLATGFNTISRSSGSSVLALGAITRSGGAINFSASNIATTTTNNTNNILGGNASYTVGGQDWARNDGSNNIVAFSAGNYTAMSSSTNLTTANFNHYLANGTVNLANTGNLFLGTLKIAPIASGQVFTGNGSFMFGNNSDNGGILFTGSHDYSFLADGNGSIGRQTAIFNYSSANLTIGRFNGLSLYGNGTTILSQNSTSSPATTVSLFGGTLRFSSNAQLGSGGNLTLGGGTFLADTYGGNISLTRSGGDRAISLGYNAPRIAVIGGNTLTINGVVSSADSIFSPIVFGSSSTNGTIILGGTNTFLGDLRLEGGTLSVNSDAQLGEVGNMLVFGGNGTFKTTGSFSANRAVAINTGYTGTFAPDSGTTFTLSQPIRGAGNLEMNGAGTLVLSGSSLYTGATRISQGILSLTNVDATAKSSGFQISGGAGLTYTGAAATLGQNITVTSGTGFVRNSGGGLLTLNGSISKNGTILRLSQGSFLVNGAITGSAANSDIYLESGGTITFTGTNTYNGPTYILNGTTLNANSAGALSASSNLIMDNTGSGSSVLNLGAHQTTGSISGNTASAINLGTHTLTTNSASSATFAGAISGDGGLAKAGSGTLSLTGSNTYAGSTAITGGTLSLGSGGTSGSLASGNISISSGAALVTNRSNTLTLSNAISGNGDIVQAGSGNTTLSGVNTNTGAVRATGGQLIFNGANSLSSGISLLEVENATLNLADGTARTANLASADLDATNSTFVFDIGASSSDMLVFGGGATLSGTRNINLNFLETLTSGQSWVLINATEGGLAGDWTLGSTSGSAQSGFSFSLSATSNALTLTAASSGSTYFWKGDLNNLWGATSGSDTNWASDSSGMSLRSTTPGADSDVIFAATGPNNLATTLGGDRTIQSLTVGVGGVEINGANTLTIDSSSASGISVSAASGTVTIGAALAGASAGLAKEGASLLVLTGNNSYGGGTLLSGGTLRMGSDTALGVSSGSLSISGNATLQASGNFTLGASRPIVVSGNGVLDTQAHTVTMAGVLSGEGSLQKTGSGSLVLNNANTITGSVSPIAGTLLLGHEDALASANLAMAGGNVAFSSSVAGNAFTLGALSANSAGAGYDIQIQNTTGQAIALTIGANNAFSTYAAALSGNGSLIKAGSGSFTLSGSNTFTGTTTINAGTLAVTGTLSASPAVTINGGTLSLNSANAVATTTTITLANAVGTTFNITANQTIGGLRGGGPSGGTTTIAAGRTLVVQESSTHSYNGTITGDGRFRFNGSGGLTLGGQVSNTGGVTVSAGTLTLASSNTYTGGTTLEGGVLNINNASALSSGILTINGGGFGNTSGGNVTLGATTQFWNADFSYAGVDTLNLGTGQVTLGGNRSISVQSGTLTVAGGISGSNLGITKAGNGTFRLQGTNSFTGGVSINEGTLFVSGGQAIADSVAVTIANTAGATLSINGSESIASLRGGGQIGGGVVIGNGATLTISETGNQTFAGTFTGSGTLIKDLAGRLNLTNDASNLSGPVFINNGILAVSSIGMTGQASALGSNSTIRIGSSNDAASATLRWEGIGSETTNKNFTTDTNNTGSNFSTGAHFFAANSGATLIISGNITSLRPNLKTLTMNGSGGSIVVSGTISNGSGPMRALITGTGNATHAFENANNSFTGAVTIQSAAANDSVGLRVTTIGNTGSNSSLGTNGTIFLGGNLSGSTSALVYAGTGETTDKILNLQGTIGNVAIEQAGTGNLKFTSNITVSAAGAKQLILQGSTAGIGEIAGLIVNSASGATSVVKNGTGTWILSGANTYTGNTTLNAGALRLDHTLAASSGTITQTTGDSLLHLNAAGTFANAMDVYNVRASEAITLSGGITVRNATFDVDNGDTLTISGGISGSGGVTKNGTGTLVLSGSNSFTGATTVNAGTLQATATNALGSTSSVVVNTGGSLLVTVGNAINNSASMTLAGGTLAMNGTFNESVGALTLTANSIIDLEGFDGTLTFSGLGDWSANTTLSITNWSGVNKYGTPVGSGVANRHVVFANTTGLNSYLDRISFYSGDFGQGFAGTAFQIGLAPGPGEIAPVPEPETWVTGVLLLLGGGFWLWKQRRQGKRV